MERLNQWLTLAANFGAVIGIVFLAYEMRLNTASMKSSTAAQSMSAWDEITLAAATNPGLIAEQIAANQEGIKLDAGGVQISYFAGSIWRATLSCSTHGRCSDIRLHQASATSWTT